MRVKYLLKLNFSYLTVFFVAVVAVAVAFIFTFTLYSALLFTLIKQTANLRFLF